MSLLHFLAHSISLISFGCYYKCYPSFLATNGSKSFILLFPLLLCFNIHKPWSNGALDSASLRDPPAHFTPHIEDLDDTSGSPSEEGHLACLALTAVPMG